MPTKHRRIKRHLWADGKTRCVRCGQTIETLEEATLDHIVAKSLGGANDRTNVALAHLECNRAHGWHVQLQRMVR